MTSIKQINLNRHSKIRPRSRSQPPLLSTHSENLVPRDVMNEKNIKKLECGDWSLDGKRIRSAMSQSLDGREVSFKKNC